MTARELALELLIKAEKSNQYSNIALDSALLKNELSTADKNLISAIFYGVIEKRITLDYQINELSKIPTKDMDASTLTALRIGLYQLIYLTRIPHHAAICETVNLCKKKSKGFVNAILRSFLRKGELALPDSNDTLNYLSVAYSVDTPLLNELLNTFGKDETEKFLIAINATPKTTLRVNTLLTDRGTLLSKIPASEPTKNSPYGISTVGSVRDTYGFEDGLFFVQDEASQISTVALGAQKNELIMDVCSCPGSKSFGAAIDMNNEGKIFSFDLHENKLSLVINGAKRLKIDIIETAACDGRKFLPDFEQKADRVICDVPCSGFGVLAKKPELRYKDPKESKSLPKIQRAILDNVCRYVKSGGVLLYSTCTVFPEENQENVNAFLKDHPEFSLVSWEAGDIRAESGMLTLLPHVHGTDGFFIAKLIRK